MKIKLAFSNNVFYSLFMKLNTQKIYEKLDEMDRTSSWLARQIGVSQQSLSYRLKGEKLLGVEKIAAVLNLPVKNLLVLEKEG